jgi:hypothetical protein
MESNGESCSLIEGIIMALKKTTTSPHGFEATDAYHRVERVSVFGKDRISFHVRSYKDADASFFSEQTFSAAYDLNGDNPIKQAYKHLKTLPEFAGASDC